MFLKVFLKKLILKKKWEGNNKIMKIYPACKKSQGLLQHLILDYTFCKFAKKEFCPWAFEDMAPKMICLICFRIQSQVIIIKVSWPKLSKWEKPPTTFNTR